MSNSDSGVVASFNIHLIWTIAVLSLSIIGILVGKPDSSIIYNYISFASAIASIVLAVVAIIYSMISNRGFDSSISEIRSSAARIADETARLNLASQGLSAEADETIKRLARLPEDIREFSGEINKKFEKIVFPSSGDDENVHNKHTGGRFDPGGMPLGMIISLYLIYLSFNKTKDVDIEDVFRGNEHVLAKTYILGFLDAMKQYNNCGIRIEGAGSAYFVTRLGKLDFSLFLEKLENYKDGGSVFDAINTVRIYFSLPPLPSNG